MADKNRSRRDCAHDRHVVWRYVDHVANKIHCREQGPLDSCASRCREEDGRESRFDLRQLLVRQIQYVYKSAHHSILIRFSPPREPIKQSYEAFEPTFWSILKNDCDAIVTVQIVIDRSPLLSPSLSPFETYGIYAACIMYVALHWRECIKNKDGELIAVYRSMTRNSRTNISAHRYIWNGIIELELCY